MTGVGCTIAGIDDVDVVARTIVVGIKLLEVDRIINGLAGLGHHLGNTTGVIATTITDISSIIGRGLAELHRTGDDIIGRVETIGRGLVEITYTTCCAVLIGIALLVEHIIVVLMGLCHRAETDIGELNEEDKHLAVSHCGNIGGALILNARRTDVEGSPGRHQRIILRAGSTGMGYISLLGLVDIHCGKETHGFGRAVGGIGGLDSAGTQASVVQNGIFIIAGRRVEN